MAETHYQWGIGERPPIIKQHSIAKHEILRAYLVSYIQTLTTSPRQDEFRLTLVDGFAGGGIYRHEKTGEEILGSPLIMLEAAKEAEFIINQQRQKKIHFDITYFFIESNKQAEAHLRHELTLRGYGSSLNDTIFLICDKFHNQSDKIIDFVKKKSPRSTKTIFLLDQYGYTDVPTDLLNTLVFSLSGSEIILTFAVDSFLNFAGDHPITKRGLERIGLSDLLNGRSFDEIKRSDKKWRLFIQSCLYKELVDASGARFYTPFFIRSTNGHGDYWLLHFSQRARARDVMTRIHWEKNNYFIHYGGAGLNMFQMLGYIPEKDSQYTGQMDLGFCFDDLAKTSSINALSEQIPHLIYPDPEGMSFGELFASTCNSSPASAAVYREALGVLLQHKEIEIFGQDGAERRSANRIHDNDQIIPPKQRTFSF